MPGDVQVGDHPTISAAPDATHVGDRFANPSVPIAEPVDDHTAEEAAQGRGGGNQTGERDQLPVSDDASTEEDEE